MTNREAMATLAAQAKAQAMSGEFGMKLGRPISIQGNHAGRRSW
jgi:uncharacterized protein YggE